MFIKEKRGIKKKIKIKNKAAARMRASGFPKLNPLITFPSTLNTYINTRRRYASMETMLDIRQSYNCYCERGDAIL